MILLMQNPSRTGEFCQHCVSDYTGSPWLEKQMSASHSLVFLRTWYNDSAYAESKPDRRIFDRAFERAGCEAHEAAMLGDRLDNDICPAKKLGMKTIRIKQGFAAYQSPTGPEYEADYTVNNLKKLLTIL